MCKHIFATGANAGVVVCVSHPRDELIPEAFTCSSPGPGNANSIVTGTHIRRTDAIYIRCGAKRTRVSAQFAFVFSETRSNNKSLMIVTTVPG